MKSDCVLRFVPARNGERSVVYGDCHVGFVVTERRSGRLLAEFAHGHLEVKWEGSKVKQLIIRY